MSTSDKAKEKMNNLLERMRATKTKMDELEYAAYVLDRQGRISEAVSKKRGAEFAKGVWRGLDAEYKKLWKRQRAKRP